MVEPINDTSTMREDLENFVLDRESLPRIEKKFVGFNVFEAIGHTHSEERHSNFLGFLLNPQESHGLGDVVLREFIVRAVGYISRDKRPVDLVKIALADLSSTSVIREHQNIDIFGINDKEKLVLTIENKIRSTEHSNQLQRYRGDIANRYPDYQKIYVYLTPYGEEPSDAEYISFTYDDIERLIKDIVDEHRDKLSSPVLSTLEQYREILRRHIVSDEDLVQLAQSIYQKHKRALDYIFEKKPDLQLQLNNFVCKLIEEKEEFVKDGSSKTYVRFAPKDWRKIKEFNSTPEDQWTKTKSTVLYEIRIAQTSMTLCIALGPTDNIQFRQSIFNYCKSKPKIFNGMTSQLSPQFTTLHSKKILSKQQLEKADLPDLEKVIQKGWDEFLNSDYPKISRAFQERFAK